MQHYRIEYKRVLYGYGAGGPTEAHGYPSKDSPVRLTGKKIFHYKYSMTWSALHRTCVKVTLLTMNGSSVSAWKQTKVGILSCPESHLLELCQAIAAYRCHPPQLPQLPFCSIN